MAEEKKPLAIRNRLFDLHDGDDYDWEPCVKTAGIMSSVFDFVDHNELHLAQDKHDDICVLLDVAQFPADRCHTSI